MFGQRVHAQQPDFGLLVVGKNTHVPLKEVTVKAQLRGYLVGLQTTLKYNNDSNNPLEVQFRFPIDESFAVVGLEAEVSGRRIKAEMREKEEAKQMYDDAMASGFTAALGEEKSGDIFSISLGNLLPKSEAHLHLKLAGELPVDDDGAVRFSLPAVLKPRYTPSGSTDPLKPIQAGLGGSVIPGSSPAVFKFEMNALDVESISHITSPTHAIATQIKPNSIDVKLENATPLDKDLVISVHLKDPHSPKAFVECGDRTVSQKKFMGSPAVMLNFFPKFESTRAACEFVFVVDRSGSMRGSFIRSASETLVLFLKSIPSGCSFNIIGFGSRYETLFPSSVPYNQQNLDKAISHAETLRADLGGTELLTPLKYVFSQRLLPGLPRQVFVLTDGSVSNTNACIQEVKNNVKNSRVFTFGIGSGASTALVKGLAKTGNGTAEFILEGERLQPKVISSLKRALQPTATDLEVQFNVTSGFDALEAPDKLPTVFNGSKTVIYGIFRSKADSDSPLEAGVSGTATLKGKVLGLSFEHTISFNVPSPEDAADTGSFHNMPIVHHLAAKSLIRDWEHKEGWASVVSDSECKQETIRVSIESNVVSAHTAYIAVDENQDKPIEGAIQTWDLTATPVFGVGGGLFSSGAGYQMRSGGGGMLFGGPPIPAAAFGGPPAAMGFGRAFPLGGCLTGSAQPSSRSHYSSGPPLPGRAAATFGAPQYAARSLNLAPAPAPPPAPGGYNFGPPPPSSAFGFSSGPPPPPPTFSAGPPAEADLLFDSFSAVEGLLSRSPGPRSKKSGPTPVVTDELMQLISLQQADGFWKLDSLTKFIKKAISTPSIAVESTVWATVIALVLMESRFSQQKDEWELVAMKAETWLSIQALPPGVDIATLKLEARKLV